MASSELRRDFTPPADLVVRLMREQDCSQDEAVARATEIVRAADGTLAPRSEPSTQPTTHHQEQPAMSTEATPKTRIITLTDRPPVRIREDDWPVIASASDDSWAEHRGDGRYAQALSRGELDRWTLKVRQHADGRVLVYGVFDAARSTTTPGKDWRGGELLDDASEIPVAIRFVGYDGDFPVHLVEQCIADLPPQEL